MPFEDHTREHFQQNSERSQMPVLGRVSVFLVLLLTFSAGFRLISFPYPAYFGLGAAIGLEALYFLWKRQRSLKKRDKAISLQSELADLKRKEFELRYEEAKMNGQLDRWKQET
ncbi:hypothetical protein [Ascidiaceihabitans sp.]|uniref:hypothetical protein n=1 Tax=Ascidiaceihabitans sp. TaxID=1872644 RepID=UPI003299D1EF